MSTAVPVEQAAPNHLQMVHNAFVCITGSRLHLRAKGYVLHLPAAYT
jgi:hypothetical protein